MLRFSITVSLLLMSGFTLVGGLLFHQWGWSEYASDALYIVYYQIKPAPFPFFIVNTDGGSDPAQLVATDATLTGLDCSPDGRTLAFVTDSARLYVVNQAGALYDRALDHAYPSLSVANNGTVALFNLGAAPSDYDVLLVDAAHALPLTPPDRRQYISVEPSSPGTLLWHRTNAYGLEVTSLTDAVIGSFSEVIFPKWLASEQVMTFGDIASSPQTRVLVDTGAQKSVRLSSAILSGVFSPDGTKRTVNRVEPGTVTVQIVITDPFTDDHPRQLTHNSRGIYSPVCFLTFRPEMLIAS